MSAKLRSDGKDDISFGTSLTYLALNIALTIIIAAILITVLSGTVMLAVVEGISMEPLLQTGDIVLVTKSKVSDLKIGDVVVYHRYGGGYIIHRIVEIKHLGPGPNEVIIITKGDNNPYPDPPITVNQIVGKVVSIGNTVLKIPALGVISLWFKSILKH